MIHYRTQHSLLQSLIQVVADDKRTHIRTHNLLRPTFLNMEQDGNRAETMDVWARLRICCRKTFKHANVGGEKKKTLDKSLGSKGRDSCVLLRLSAVRELSCRTKNAASSALFTQQIIRAYTPCTTRQWLSEYFSTKKKK